MKGIVKILKSTFALKSRSSTVRYMFPAVMSMAALLGAAVITSEDVSYVRLETTETLIEEWEQFSIDVYAYAHVPVNAVDITLKFDPTAVEVVGVDVGQSVITLWTEEPSIEDSSVRLQGGTYKKGFLDEHLIATINLKAKQSGQSDVEAADVILLAGDGQATSVTVAEALDSTVSLYVYDENTAPEGIGIDVKVDIITDLNGDGKVSLKDISIFMSAWRSKKSIYDFNGDGKMSFRDFSIILANYFF